MVHQSHIAIYEAADGQVRLEVNLDMETVWLTQQQMAELYETSRVNVTEHIAKAYRSKELEKEATSRKFRLVQTEGIRKPQIPA